MIKKTCCSRFLLHRFVQLKFLWTQFKTMLLQGLCSLRPCISRPYCSIFLSCLVSSHLKYLNLQFNTQVHWTDGTNDQVSDVSSIIFFHDFLQNSLQKWLQCIFLFLYIVYIFTKIKTKSFECSTSILDYEKK